MFALILYKWVCRFLGGLKSSSALVGALSGLSVALISPTCTPLGQHSLMCHQKFFTNTVDPHRGTKGPRDGLYGPIKALALPYDVQLYKIGDQWLYCVLQHRKIQMSQL